MMRRVVLGVFLLMSASFSLEAMSLLLQNETSYTLRAVITGADGSPQGETIVPPGQQMRWFAAKSPDAPVQGPSKPITPMVVHWFCEDGEVFCVSEHATSGSLIRTTQCEGKRVCKPKKEEEAK